MEWFTFEVLLWRFLCDLTAMVSSVHSVNDSNEAWFGFVHLEASIWICPSFSNLAEVSSKSRTRNVHTTMHWVFRMQGCFVFVRFVWLLLHPHTCLTGYWDHAKSFPLVCGPMVTIYLFSKFLNPQKLGIPNACFTLEENIVFQVFLQLV
jgi:hypothetical protein